MLCGRPLSRPSLRAPWPMPLLCSAALRCPHPQVQACALALQEVPSSYLLNAASCQRACSLDAAEWIWVFYWCLHAEEHERMASSADMYVITFAQCCLLIQCAAAVSSSSKWQGLEAPPKHANISGERFCWGMPSNIQDYPRQADGR